jgi:beta-lactamase superfamily II metal-dependent hydrolase
MQFVPSPWFDPGISLGTEAGTWLVEQLATPPFLPPRNELTPLCVSDPNFREESKMSVIKSFSVGNGDMFYIKHNSDNFTTIDCDLCEDNADRILEEFKRESQTKGVSRFICTHPDEDHFGGIERLDDEVPIVNFYVVKNQAVKDEDTVSFKRYRKLRDSDKAFYIEKGCARKWMNVGDTERGSSGLTILWPDLSSKHFREALASCDAGESYNNTSAVIRYSMQDGASFMWLGDLDNGFMEKITDEIELKKTTVVFAAHHGRDSGKIPDSWLDKIDPQFIVIGEAPSRHLHYYTGYHKITQNSARDITFDLDGADVHVYSSNAEYSNSALVKKGQNKFKHYVGSFAVEA